MMLLMHTTESIPIFFLRIARLHIFDLLILFMLYVVIIIIIITSAEMMATAWFLLTLL